MSVTFGALLSAIAGGITAWFDAQRKHDQASSGAVLLRTLGGAILAALSYGAFLVAGLVVGVLTFSTTPQPWPALIGVVLGCVIFLIIRIIQSAFASHFGMPVRRNPSRPRSFDDLLDARARGGASTMWLGGVLAALLPISYGVNCIVTRQGKLGTVLWPGEVTGPGAIALGIGWIGIGLFLHFHFFFGLHPTLQAHSRQGKTVALILAFAGLGVGYAWPATVALR